MKKMLLYSVCLAGVCAGMQLGAAEYRLEPGMDFETVNRKVQPGDTVILANGRHVGQIKPCRSGEPGKPITYRGEAGALLYNDKVSHSFQNNKSNTICFGGITFSLRHYKPFLDNLG